MTAWLNVTGDPIAWLVTQLDDLQRPALRRATVIVPSQRHAHALRRRVCVEIGRPALLAGVWVAQADQVAAELHKLSTALDPTRGTFRFELVGAALRQQPSLAGVLGSVVALLPGSPSAALSAFLDELPLHRGGFMALAGGTDVDVPAANPEDDLEAAAVWLAEQVAAGVSAEEIALLTPDVDAYAVPLADRLRRLTGGEKLGLYIAGGLPVTSTPGGQRLHSLLEALASGLSAPATIRILPALKRGPGDDPTGPPRLSLSRAAAVVYGAGIVGGAPDDVDGVCQWVPGLRRRRAALLAAIEATDVGGSQRSTTINRQLAERWLRDVEPILPAIQALQALGERVVLGAELADLWRDITDFCPRWLRMPPDPPHLLSLLASCMRAASRDNPAAAGVAAVEVMLASIRAARVPSVQYGTPKIFLGTLQAAAGLPFAVRQGLAAPLRDHSAAAYAAAHPLTPRSLLEHVPAVRGGSVAVPPAWLKAGALRLDAIQTLDAARHSIAWTSMDGALGDTWSLQLPMGLSRRRPISASAASLLLSCPHRFLFERILRCAPPVQPPNIEAIDPIVYGALFHSVAQTFLSTAGAAVCTQEGDLQEWRARARAIAVESLQSLRDVYPLRGTLEVEREAERLAAQIDAFVCDEWDRPPRQFLASELGFGEPDAVGLALEGGEIFLRGSIDRVDRRADGSLSVRDLKTGRVPALDTEPLNAARDLQIGVYVLIVEAIGLGQVGEAGYVSPHPAGAQRTFTAVGLDELRARTREWLHLVHTLLRHGMFPRTSNPADCRYCSFRVVCGAGAQQRSAAKLEALPASHPLRGFASFKRRCAEAAGAPPEVE